MSEQTSGKRDTVGIVLGGGGARGLCHIGVLNVLHREGIPIDLIAGTSIGGLVGATYAAGVPVETVHAEVKRISRIREQMRLVDISLSSAGLSVSGRRIYNFLADLIGEDVTFADLNIPLAMVAVDIHTSRPVVLQGGRVIDAVRATISVPGVFASVELGDYRLVDGGVLDNLPVDVARAMGATKVIAVDVLPNFDDAASDMGPVKAGLQLPFAPQNLNELYHVLMIMIAAQTSTCLREYPADLLIRPEIPAGVSLLTGFTEAEATMAAGTAAAEAALPAIRDLLSGD